MKKTLTAIIIFLAVLLIPRQMTGIPADIMPLDQIKTGMKGIGRTVFLGSDIEEFKVEILGVMRNFQPKKSLILARLDHEVLKKTGVIEGMSGSPVYIEGKLIGAVSYSIGEFIQAPIAGITPIEEMLKIPERGTPQTSFPGPVPFRKSMTLDDLINIGSPVVFRAAAQKDDQGRLIRPLNVPLIFKGFSSGTFNRAKGLFQNLGFLPVAGGGSGRTDASEDFHLREGDPVGAQLVSGDMDMTAVGTVTHVDGNRVLAFGHPIYNLGAVNYVMTKARVLTVVPSLTSSFKLSVPGAQVGRFVQDRSVGVQGELGKDPRMIPLNITIEDEDAKPVSYRVNLAEDNFLSAFLVNMAVAGILEGQERSSGDLTLEMDGNIFLGNNRQIHFEDFFSGNFGSTITDLSGLFTSSVFFLLNNEFKDVEIYRIDINVRSMEDVRFAYLEKVWLDKYDASPGEPIRIKVFMRSFRGDEIVQEGGILAPNLPSGSVFYLAVGDSEAMQRIESTQYKVRDFIPRSLEMLIRILNNLRKNNRVYFKVFAEKPGLFLKGEEMPNLPPSLKSMFTSSRAASSSPTELSSSTLGNYQLAIPYVFQGSALIPIKIK